MLLQHSDIILQLRILTYSSAYLKEIGTVLFGDRGSAR